TVTTSSRKSRAGLEVAGQEERDLARELDWIVEGLVEAAEVEAVGEVELDGGVVDVLRLHPQAPRVRCSGVLRERLEERGAAPPTAVWRRDVEVRDGRAPVPGRRFDLREAHHAAVCL